jgi:hypothetical protein
MSGASRASSPSSLQQASITGRRFAEIRVNTSAEPIVDSAIAKRIQCSTVGFLHHNSADDQARRQNLAEIRATRLCAKYVRISDFHSQHHWA